MPGKASQRRLERLAALEVEVVRRLVEHEQVRAARDDEREREPPPLAAGERAHRLLVLLPAREEEPAEELLRLRAPQPGRGDRGVEHRAALVELRLVLGEVRGLDAVAELDPPRGGLAPAEHRLEQRRLARAVRADERHVLAALEREARRREQRLVARAEREPVGLDHDPARALRVQELEPERPPLAGARLRPGAFRRSISLCFDFAWLAFVALAPKRSTNRSSCAIFSASRSALRACELGPRRLLAPPEVPLAREVDRAAAVELEHRRRHRLEEPAVVRDEDHRGVDRREQPLEPLDRLDVEVVRRLVEQQQVGLGGERARQRGPRQLAARERRERPVEVGVGEAEAAHDGGGAVAPVVAARMLEPALRRRVARERPRVVRRRRPSSARARAARSRARRGRPSPRARTPAAAGRSRRAAAGRAARRGRPSPRRARRPRARPRR